MEKFLIDSNLSLEAKGLLTLALELSKTEAEMSLELLKQHCSDSSGVISRILKELALYGYMTRKKTSNGRLHYEYNFFSNSRLNNFVKYYVDNNVFVFSKSQLKTLLPESYFADLWFEVS